MNVLFICALKEESDGLVSLFDCPIIHTGVGKINAGYKTALAIQKYNPDLICNFGSCGSFTIPKGELVKVKEVFNGDMDAEPLVPFSITPFDEKGGNFEIGHSGVNCFTSETFITREKTQSFSTNKLDLFKKSDIFEMELYSVVKVCKEFNKPVISYKWVSDDGGVEDWKENCKAGFERFKTTFINNHIND